MEAFYKDNHNTIYCLDFRKNELPNESVQMVCTSPPYWGLRKYSGEQELIWGGEPTCEHDWISKNHKDTRGVEGSNLAGRIPYKEGEARINYIDGFCSLCGAWKGAYGLEPTPEMYIEHTIEILREIRRVLRKDGVCFWNIGDSYATSPAGNKEMKAWKDEQTGKSGRYRLENYRRDLPKDFGNLKPKDLCLIPFRVAIAAQEDGWWVRSVIIWSKPNPMPESVTDRPTESHEYILMLTKSGTSQYWTHRDHESTRTQPKPDYRWQKHSEPDMKAIAKEIGGMSQRTVWEERDGEDRGWREAAERQHSTILEETDIKPEGWTPKNKMGWDRVNLWKGHDYYWDADAVREKTELEADVHWPASRGKKSQLNAGQPIKSGTWDMSDERYRPAHRNIRSVWEFPTQPYPEAHFAVFPEKLPEICIKAATPEVGCCSKCGAPWERITETSYKQHRQKGKWEDRLQNPDGYNRSPGMSKYGTATKISETLGWQPTCKCNADKVPSMVLDPMMGAGTTLWVAKKLNRYAVGYDTSVEYCQLAVDRCRQQVLL
ncbi:hypothetical protein ES703_05405 [subsurface metagenome]